MEIAAGGVRAARSGFGDIGTSCVADMGKGHIGLGQDRRVVKFVAAQAGAGGDAGDGVGKGGVAVTEMHLAVGITGFQAEKACHFVTGAVRVHKSGTHDHIAATFAVDGSGFGKGAEGGFETGGGGEGACVKFGVATGQPADIGGWIGRFIGDGRKGQDFSTLGAPVGEKMGVDEAEEF